MMLRVKVFGCDPVPAWAQDETLFRSWVQCRIGLPSHMPRAQPKTFPVKQEAKFLEEVDNKRVPEPKNLLAWELQDPERFSFGWGGFRCSIAKNELGHVHLEMDEWGICGWRPLDAESHSWALSFFWWISGVRKNAAPPSMQEQELFSPIRNLFSVAPWSREHHMNLGSLCVLGHINQQGAFEFLEMQIRPPTECEQDFSRWVSHRLRGAARLFPALRRIWWAGRIRSNKKEDLPVGRALQALNADPQWMRQSLDWLAFSRTDLFENPTLGWSAFRFREYLGCESNLVAYIFEGYQTSDVLGVSVARSCVRRWSDRLPLAQAGRLFKAAEATVKQNPGQDLRSHILMVIQLLACAKLRVPSVARLKHLLNNSWAMNAWLLQQPGWRSSNNYWPCPNYWLDHGDGQIVRAWKQVLVNMKKQHLHDPVAFQALSNAVLAWVKSPVKREGMTIAQTLEADIEVFSQLESAHLTRHLQWNRLGAKVPWVSYLRLLRRARSEALVSRPQDMQAGRSCSDVPKEETDSTTPDDAPWSSALGMFNVGDIKVIPLCRPSHLNSVGEFFQNCMVANNRLDLYVQAARLNMQRFFRLEAEDSLAFLAIEQNGDEQAWIVADVRGRFNKETTEAMQKAATQVAQFYTQLVPATLTFTDDDLDDDDLDEDGLLD